MLHAHLDMTYLTHRITNAVTEGLNAKIQWIKYSARGYRNREAFELAIHSHCGSLDLNPHGAGRLPTANPEEPFLVSRYNQRQNQRFLPTTYVCSNSSSDLVR